MLVGDLGMDLDVKRMRLLVITRQPSPDKFHL